MEFKPALAVVYVSLFGLVSCQQHFEESSTQNLQSRMIELCGDADKACVTAVNLQFQGCEKQYQHELANYLNANSNEEDAILEIYMGKMFSCVVDAEHHPYFHYKPVHPQPILADQGAV